MKIIAKIALCFLVVVSSELSAIRAQDLIPNGGFEHYDYLPLKWCNTGKDFSQIFTHWSSPTQASPDAYGPDISVPRYWRKKGFGHIVPIRGRSFAGLTLYGCKGGKPHCREYLQVRMTEPLVPGQKYELSFFLSPLQRGLRINNIGVGFSYDSIQSRLDNLLELKPAGRISSIVEAEPNKWMKATLLFQADAREEFMIVGNFYSDKDTKIKKDVQLTEHHFAYYYFDDFQLNKIPPIIHYVDTTNTYLSRTFDLDEHVVLENVYFDHDKTDLKPKSYLTLSHLLELLVRYPDMVIELIGHTDSDGTPVYNDGLAVRRAKKVHDYLIYKQVDPARLSYRGEGEFQPLSTNTTDRGKALNRRVEFRVVAQ